MGLPIIDITEHEYVEQVTKEVFTTGGESIICKTSSTSELDKFFVDSNTRKLISMPANKVAKIKKLYDMHLDHSTRPLAMIATSGRIVGYRMNRPKGYVPLEDAKLSRKQKIFAIRQTKGVLKDFAYHDVTYGDIKGDNILVNPRTCDVVFCDMDNARIGDLPVDLVVSSLMRYYEITGVIDEKADAYMHNLFTLQQLGYKNAEGEYYSDIIRDIRRKEYPTGFKLPARQIMESMLSPQEFTGEYVAQYIKR